MNTIRTNPGGRWFISYKRENAGDISLLAEILREHGIPVWVDTTDLAHEPTEAELRRVLAEADTAGAVLFMTESVANSAMIRRVEAPTILKRHTEDGSFGVIPVACGISYTRAAELYDHPAGLVALSSWNTLRVERPLSEDSARLIALHVLRARLKAIHAMLPLDEPLRLVLNTRVLARFDPDVALSIDWSHQFDPRHCSEEIWARRLLPVLREIVDAISQIAPGRRVIASGLLGLPAALALGMAFSTTRGISLGWQQSTRPGVTDHWSLDDSSQAIALREVDQPQAVDGEDVAIALSITADVRDDVARSVKHLPGIRCSIDVGLDETTQSLNGAQAAYVVERLVSRLRGARSKYGGRGAVHFFMAAPTGLVVMLGQFLNTFRSIATYEYEMDGMLPYRRAAVIVLP